MKKKSHNTDIKQDNNKLKIGFKTIIKAIKKSFLNVIGIIFLVIAWHIQTNQLAKTQERLNESSKKWVYFGSLLGQLRTQDLEIELLLLNKADSIPALQPRLEVSYMSQALLYLSILKEGEGLLDGSKFEIPDSLKINFIATKDNIINTYNKRNQSDEARKEFYKMLSEIKKIFEQDHKKYQEFFIYNLKEGQSQQTKQDKFYIAFYVLGIIFIWIEKIIKSIANEN